eukprot:2929541-Rhodomonas_salina.6
MQTLRVMSCTGVGYCCYAYSTRYPVLTYAIPLPGLKTRGCGIHGGGRVCKPPFAQGVRTVLRAHYAMSSTDLGYAATRFYIERVWGLKRPKLFVSVTGGLLSYLRATRCPELT